MTERLNSPPNRDTQLSGNRSTPLDRLDRWKPAQRRLKRAGAAMALAAVSAFAAIAQGSDELAGETTAQIEFDKPILTKQQPRVDLVIVNTPGVKPHHTTGEILDSLTTESRMIEYATDGANSLTNDVKVENITLKTQGKTDDSNETDCYTGEQAERLVRERRQRTNLGDTAIAAIVFNGEVGCSAYVSAAAYASGINGNPFIVINQLGNWAHEAGHVWGLAHAKEIEVLDYPQTRPDVFSWYDTADFVDGKEPYYQLVRNFFDLREGQVLTKKQVEALQTYSSDDSVMGEEQEKYGSSLYTAGELETISGGRFTIQDVPYAPGEYQLSFAEGERVGIRVPLPADHPIRNIDNGITSLVFGLDTVQGDPELKNGSELTLDDQYRALKLVVSAKGDRGTYTLGNTYVDIKDITEDDFQQNSWLRDTYFAPRLVDNPFEVKFVYIDPKQGLIVSVTRDAENKPVVRLETIAESEWIRNRYRDEYARRQVEYRGSQPLT